MADNRDNLRYDRAEQQCNEPQQQQCASSGGSSSWMCAGNIPNGVILIDTLWLAGLTWWFTKRTGELSDKICQLEKRLDEKDVQHKALRRKVADQSAAVDTVNENITELSVKVASMSDIMNTEADESKSESKLYVKSKPKVYVKSKPKSTKRRSRTYSVTTSSEEVVASESGESGYDEDESISESDLADLYETLEKTKKKDKLKDKPKDKKPVAPKRKSKK